MGANFVVSLHIPFHVANGDLEAKAELLAIVCQDRSLQSAGPLSLNQTRQHDIKGMVKSVDVIAKPSWQMATWESIHGVSKQTADSKANGG
jgi:hypothetical protein